MKKFTKNDEGFICFNCRKEVEQLNNSSRDHCNFCLYGLHVDINPGDRLNDCKGVLEPIGLKTSNGKTQIAYKCQKCGKIIYCKKAEDDNPNKILELNTKIWEDSN